MKSLEKSSNYPKKCKLELILPFIKCIDRRNARCFYRGKILEGNNDFLLIEFKYKGNRVTGHYLINKKKFQEPEFYDIKLDELSIK